MKRGILLLVVAWPALALFAPAAIAQDDDDGAVVQQTTSLPPSTKLAPEQTTTRERTPAQGAIPGQYIVVLKEEVRDPTAVAREHARRHGAQVLHIYQHALKGYAARIPDQRLEEVLAEERIDYIERDGKVTTVAQRLPWGIDRINADRSSTRAGNGTGALSNVNAYIIDTGIDKTHTDLNVVEHVNFHGGRNTDCNGHGTHVAGTVAAEDNNRNVVGVAPGAPLTGVKVVGCDGSGSVSGLIAGIAWVTADALKLENAKKAAIANLSLDTAANRALDEAVKASAASGVFYSVAAGNDGRKACQYSPARAGAGKNNGIVTTAATNKSNAEPWWSNYGRCVDLWAPGANVLSTKKGGGTTTKSGTSMASPHVGGGAALYLSSHRSASPTTVESALKKDATRPGTSSDGGAIKRLNVGGY
jgi:subtilisin family serine protease